MLIRTIILIFAVSIFVSCGSSSATSSTRNEDPHVREHLKMHEEAHKEEIKKTINENFMAKLEGEYTGVIPCADCEGIRYDLRLHSYKSYSLTTKHIGKDENNHKIEGYFEITDKLLVVLKTPSGKELFLRLEENGLRVLDRNGNPYTGTDESRYILKKKDDEQLPESEMSRLRVMQDRYQKGMVFYALGNEPFWSLDLSKDGRFFFKTLEGFQATLPKGTPEIEGAVKRYKTDQSTISITKQSCNDTMSDEVFDYSVQVTINGKTFNGCGNEVPDFSLHDIWMVTKIQGVPVNKKDYKDNIPMMEINLSNGTVMGTDGCNRFNGKVKASNGTITFGPLAGTLKACMVNNKMTVLLSGGTFKYRPANGSLLIYNDHGPVIELKHID